MSLVPDAVLMSMCAPEVEPCWASYMEVLTRSSSIDSGAGVGSAWPIARYGEALVWTTPLPEPALTAPALLTMRAEATWLVLLPLKRLLASTPLSRKLLLVSRWPLAQ